MSLLQIMEGNCLRGKRSCTRRKRKTKGSNPSIIYNVIYPLRGAWKIGANPI